MSYRNVIFNTESNGFYGPVANGYEVSGYVVSRHASERMQQRCIPALILHWLIAYGRKQKIQSGTEIIYFDKVSRHELRAYAGRLALKRLADFLDAYLIVRNEVVITAGHRYQRIVTN